MIQKLFQDALDTHQLLVQDPIFLKQVEQVAQACATAIQNKNTIFLCGNGGSFADAQHIAAEFVGRFLVERGPLPAICLGTNASSVTAIGNDYSFNDIFSRELLCLAKPNDVCIGITTSGNSPNVVSAIKVGLQNQVTVFGLTSNKQGAITQLCPCIEVPSSSTPRVQECHILIGHIICQWVDHVGQFN